MTLVYQPELGRQADGVAHLKHALVLNPRIADAEGMRQLIASAEQGMRLPGAAPR